MSDYVELKARLRDTGRGPLNAAFALDAIEALEAKVARLQNTIDYMGSLTERLDETEDKLAKSVELLILCRDMFDEVAHPSDPLSVMLNEAIAEIKGETK